MRARTLALAAVVVFLFLSAPATHAEVVIASDQRDARCRGLLVAKDVGEWSRDNLVLAASVGVATENGERCGWYLAERWCARVVGHCPEAAEENLAEVSDLVERLPDVPVPVDPPAGHLIRCTELGGVQRRLVVARGRLGLVPATRTGAPALVPSATVK